MSTMPTTMANSSVTTPVAGMKMGGTDPAEQMKKEEMHNKENQLNNQQLQRNENNHKH